MQWTYFLKLNDVYIVILYFILSIFVYISHIIIKHFWRKNVKRDIGRKCEKFKFSVGHRNWLQVLIFLCLITYRSCVLRKWLYLRMDLIHLPQPWLTLLLTTEWLSNRSKYFCIWQCWLLIQKRYIIGWFYQRKDFGIFCLLLVVSCETWRKEALWYPVNMDDEIVLMVLVPS